MTRWVDVETEGDTHYLVGKAEDLIERIEDGRGLNIVLPAALKGTGRSEETKRATKDKSTRPNATEPSPTKKKRTKETEPPRETTPTRQEWPNGAYPQG
jgi:hypothetical protein